MIGALVQHALVILPYCHASAAKIESIEENNNKSEGDVVSYPMKEMFDCVDSKNIEGFLSYLADDVRFRFGNAPALIGKPAIKEGVRAFYSQIEALEHVMTGVWTADDVTIVEFESYYTRHTGITVGVPCCCVLRFNADQLIYDYRINIDLSPVFADTPDSHLIRASA